MNIRECRFCGQSHPSIQYVERAREKNYCYVVCANGRCSAQGPVRESRGAAIDAWNEPLPAVWSSGGKIETLASD